ncbi:MAG: DUF211 domain-containing protein [Promethearchaeota archaeon]|jgi:hypothetical protein
MMKVEWDLDILKPHSPSVDYVAHSLMEIEGITQVNVKLDELDQKTASLHIKIMGIDVSLEDISEKLTSLNCAIHSVDEVCILKED